MKKFKNITKMIAALGLAWVLLTNLFPVMVYAEADTMSFAELQTELDNGGTVTLEKDVVWKEGDSGPLQINPDKTVTLDLNGHTIDRGLEGKTAVENDGNVITVNGNLTLTDSSAGKNGTITGGNTRGYCGGVKVNNGTFIMEAGTITGCSATVGGGVYVVNGTFTMKGGTITGCMAVMKINEDGVMGGGVYVDYNSNFNVSGTPVISGNNHVFVDNSTLDDNVNFYRNSTINVTGALGANASIGFFPSTSADVVIARGTGSYEISADDAEKFHNDDTTHTHVRDVDNGKYVIRQVEPGTWNELQKRLQYGGNVVKLERDYTSGSSNTTLEVPEGKTVTLDLNDHFILYKGTGSAPVITVNGNLTLKDSKTQKTKRYITLTDGRATGVSDSNTSGAVEVTGGFIAGGNNENNIGGGVYVYDSCMFTMEGGTIVGCKALSGGGGSVNNSGMFTMEGGTIVGCKALYDGGGVYVNNTGNFNMNGGGITNCTANGSGEKRGGGGVYVSSSGKFNMESGSITNCTADSGGGVFVLSGNFKMNGGNITDCTATSQGGGVYVYGGTFKVSGAPVIRVNKKGDKTNNVALDGSKTITVTGALADGAEIRVSEDKGKVIANPVNPSGSTTAYTITAADAACFHSDLGDFTGTVHDGNVVFKNTLPTATLSNTSVEYNGSAFSPATSFSGQNLTKDSDYTLSYEKVVAIQETPLSGAPKDAGSYNLVVAGKGEYAGIRKLPFTITKKPVTVSGITVKDKEYDGGTTAELITTNAVFTGKCDGDTLTVSATGAGTFADKVPGENKIVNIDADKFVLGGASAGNYELAGGHQSTATGRISKKSITITGVTAANKEYDGNTTATTDISHARVTGLVGTDTVAFTVAGAFADAGAGNNKTVTLSGWSLTSGGDNYVIDAAKSQKTTTASITGVKVYIDGLSAQDKVYDGNKTARVTGTATLKKVKGNAAVGGLTVSDITAEFENENAGNNKTVTITGGKLSDPKNYILVPDATKGLKADIAKANAVINVPGVSLNKKYGDGAFSLNVTTNIGATPIFAVTKGSDVISLSGDRVTILKPGEAAIKLSLPGTANYVAAEDKTISISVAKADAPATKPEAAVLVPYETVKVSEVSLPADWTWSDSDKDKELIEEGTVTATAEYSAADKDYYSSGLTAAVEITRLKKPTIPLDGAIISGVTEKTYNGTAQTQDPIVSLDGRTLVNGTDYTISYTNNVEAGTATMIITGTGNYEGSKSVTFRILSPAQAKDITNVVVTGLDATGYEYTGKVIKPGIEVYIGGTKLTVKKDYTISYKNNKNAGTATITIKGKGKTYKGTKKVTFTINKTANPLKAVGKTTTLKSKNVTKKKQNISVGKIIKITKKGKGKLTYSKISGDERFTVTSKNGKVTVAKGTPAGTYTLEVEVSASGDKNHEIGTSTATVNIIIK